ncbi:MAG: YbfB/YjiJ family MFS transporter, partial [Sciscionella sp.]
LGYLLGALLAAPVVARLGEHRSFYYGLSLIALSLAASAITGDVPVLLVLRLVAGAAGAVCFVVGGGLTAQAGRGSQGTVANLMLAVYFAGGGLGVLLSGLLVPAVLDVGGWRLAWLALGGLSVLGLAAAVPAARAVPASPVPDTGGGRHRLLVRGFAPLLVAYALFGAGYIAYMTFIVAYLDAAGASGGEVTLFWAVLGIATVAAAFAWRPVLGAVPGWAGTAIVLAVLAVGASLPLVSTGTVVSLLSAVLFGGAFLTVVTVVTSTARDILPAHHWTRAIAVLTVAFALGQCLGPVLAGVLSDFPGGIRLGLGVGAVLLVLSIPAALVQGRDVVRG